MNVPFLNGLSPRRRKVVIWIVGLLMAYTIGGFLIVPPIIRAIAVKRLSKELDRPVTIEKVKLNPYALSATIRGLLIRDKDGEAFVSWDEVYVNFQLISFFTRPWVFKEVSTSQPYVRVQVKKDYTLNFSDLLEKFSKASTDTARPKGPSKPVALRIELLRISGAKASLVDLTPREPFRRTVGPLEITLTKFRTDPNNKNPYSFAGTTDSGEQFSWSGHFYLNPIRSQGEFTLQGVSLNKYAPLYQDLVRFDIRDGVIDLRSTYEIEKSAGTNLVSITNTTFRLTSLKVAEKGAEQNVVELGSLVVAGASGDMMGRRGEVSNISVKDGRFAVHRGKDASVNVLELAKPAESATNASGGILLLLESVTNAFAMLLQSTNLWTGAIHDLSVSNCAVHLDDEVNARPARLEVDQITFNAKELSNVPGTNMSASLSLRWETNGVVRANVDAGLSPPRADVRLALENVNLRPLDPYLEPHVNVFVLRSQLGMDGTIHLRRTNDSLPEVTFQGNVRLDDFSTVDGVWSDDLVKWGSLRISDIDANLNPPVVSVKEVAVKDAYARLIVETNRTINLLTALHQDLTNAAPVISSAPESPKKKGSKNQGTVVGKVAPVRDGKASTLPAKISIGSVVLTNMHLQFTDRSLQPNVNASIEQVSGTISGLASDKPQRADVNLRGKVGKTGPVEITGKLNPLDQKQPAEVKIAFKDIDLNPAGPYASKFLGYRLTKGKLSMDLSYQLADRKLKSQNLIVLDQVTLGEKVESPDATKLPIRLALAVLKDRNGKIELDVPIDGSLDDPQFHLGKVINRAILNVITKIVTSPFTALSAVFGGKGEEISFQEFEAGKNDLSPSGVEKLDALVKGLYERPGLQLEIEGSVDSKADLEALRRQKLDKEFRLAKWRSLRKSERARLSADEVQLTPEERADYMKAAYAVAFSPQAIAARAEKSGPANVTMVSVTNSIVKSSAPAQSGGTENLSEKGATALLKQAAAISAKLPATDMEAQLLETVEVTASDFQTIATGRAERVKEYILKTGKVEPERVFLTQAGEQAFTAKGSRVYLHLR